MYIELEHRDKRFVWQIVCAYLTAHTEFGLKFSGSIIILYSMPVTVLVLCSSSLTLQFDTIVPWGSPLRFPRAE
jgi:hypothetical protein